MQQKEQQKKLIRLSFCQMCSLNSEFLATDFKFWFDVKRPKIIYFRSKIVDNPNVIAKTFIKHLVDNTTDFKLKAKHVRI